MSYERIFDAIIPPVVMPTDITEQRYAILENYGYTLDIFVTMIYNTLFTHYRENPLSIMVNDQAILNAIYEDAHWLNAWAKHAYVTKVNSGTDLLRIDEQVVRNILNELLVTLYKKYRHNAWECLYRFLNMAHAEIGNYVTPIRIDLIGIAINVDLQIYELRAKAYTL